jgi:hypothetical protein
MEQPQNNLPTQSQNQAASKPSKTLGIISLVTGIIGFFAFGIILGVVALVTGLVEKPRSGLSVAGIVLGIVDIVGAIYFLSIL